VPVTLKRTAVSANGQAIVLPSYARWYSYMYLLSVLPSPARQSAAVRKHQNALFARWRSPAQSDNLRRTMTVEDTGPEIEVTSAETIAELVGQVRDGTPIRIAFAQRRDNDIKTPGPLADFVTAGDLRALLLYLLAMARASRKEPWNVVLPAAVWARALGIDLPLTKTASSTISKAWARIEDRKLIHRGRSGRLAEITLLREDGSGKPYTHPKDEGGYFKLPHVFWLEGPQDSEEPWYEVLDLPAVAMLLIASSLQPNFALALDRVPQWYGFSTDTAHRGFATLAEHEILQINKVYKKAPLSPLGYTYENRYRLNPPFKHRRGAAASRSNASDVNQ
jgi:hypothetical protein